MKAKPDIRAAFTLLELLIAVSIVTVLMGMLVPALGIVRRAAEKANTENLMRKVDTALQGYRKDARAFPFLAGPAAVDGPWGNDLAYHLTHDLGTDEASKLNIDVAAARAAYLPGGDHCIVAVDVDQPKDWIHLSGGPESDGSKRAQMAVMANRLGGERAVVGVLSGNIAICGTGRNGGARWKDRTSPVISARSRGWAADYLSGELEKREVSIDSDGLPESIIDYYGKPLVYVNPVINGVTGFMLQKVQLVTLPEWYGFQVRPRKVTQSIVSDIGDSAARQHVADYELWSSGKDGLFNGQRDSLANKDNVSIVRYQKGLQ